MNPRDEESSDRLAIVFSNTGHAITHMYTVLYATAVLYLPKVFDLPYGEMLALSSLGLVLFGVAALPAGWLGDRWSQVGMMVIFFIGIGASAIFIGLANGSKMLFAGLTLIGLFASIYHPVGIAWIVAAAERQGMTLGINGVFGNAGGSLAPVFVGVMIDHGAWRAAFIIPGLLAIAVGAGLLIAWRRGHVRDIRADRAPRPPPQDGAFLRVFIVLTITMACGGFVYTGLTNTMPKLFELGLSAIETASYTRIGIMVGAVSGIASLASVAGGWMADRYSARSIYIVFWLLQAPLLFILVRLNDAPLLAAALAALSFLLAFAAAENMLIARYTPFRWRALAYGAKFVLALGVGGLTVHFAGWLFDRDGGFGLLYTLFGAAALLAATAAVILPAAPSARPRPPPPNNPAIKGT